MVASIFGERFLGHREPAWHGLGKTFEAPLSASEAVRECRLDYNVVKLPLAGQLVTPLGTQLVTVDNKIMIAREPTKDDPQYRYFGIASPDYTIIQNTDVAAALDALTETWAVETVGAIGKGETVFFVLDAGMVDIKGEAVHEYFLVTDTRDGGTSLKIAFTPVRVVCQNTLITGLKQAVLTTSMEHSPSLTGEFRFRIGLMDQMNKARAEVAALFGKMASIQLDKDEVAAIFTAAYPDPIKPKKMGLIEEYPEELDIAALGDLYNQAQSAQEQWQYYCNRQAGFRAAANELFEKLSDEYPGVAGTAWAGYNAVVELADFRRGSDGVQESTLFGQRSKEKVRAFRVASSFVE